jgi:hypothetical protein
MEGLFNYDRMTPSRSRKIAAAISGDREKAREFADISVDRLAVLIPRIGTVRIEQLEEAFIMALEIRKVFDAANLSIWDFFPRPSPPSLLGHVFISAVEGVSLRDLVESARFCFVNQPAGVAFDAEKFSRREVKRPQPKALAG